MPLEFGEDEVAESAPNWVKHTRIRFEVLPGSDPAQESVAPTPDAEGLNSQAGQQAGDAAGGNSINGSDAAPAGPPPPPHGVRVRVHSPVLRGVAVDDVSKLSAEDRRFVGSLYIKVGWPRAARGCLG